MQFMPSIRLVQDWRHAYRWLSIQLSTVGATGAAVWVLLSEKQQEDILRWLGIDPGLLAGITFAAIAVGRLVDQHKAQP
jgi:hypothetical protein